MKTVEVSQSALESLQKMVEQMQERNNELLSALKEYVHFGCPICGGDCHSANPPVASCMMKNAMDLIAKCTVKPEVLE